MCFFFDKRNFTNFSTRNLMLLSEEHDKIGLYEFNLQHSRLGWFGVSGAKEKLAKNLAKTFNKKKNCEAANVGRVVEHNTILK